MRKNWGDITQRDSKGTITYFKGMQYSEVLFHAAQIFGLLYSLKILDL